MVSFQCDGCGDVVKKPKLNQHRNRCYATFTCIDCSTTFQGTSYQSHNSCITEAQKFQKHIYNDNHKNDKSAPVKDKKPVSIIDQLNEKKKKTTEEEESKKKKNTEEEESKKRKNTEEVAVVKEPKKKSKKEKKTLSSWSETELDEDESKNLENALKEVLKSGKPLCLKDARKKTIALIEKHPKYKKSDLKKSFDKKFNLTLKDNVIQFA